MKNFVLLFIMGACSFVLSAQSNWSRTYRIEGANEYALQGVLRSDTFLVFSFSGSESGFTIAGVQFNDLGEIILRVAIDGAEGIGISHYPGLTMHNNYVILSGESFPNFNYSMLNGLKIDPVNLHLDHSWSIPPDSNYFRFIAGHQRLTGNALLFYGSRRQAGVAQSHGYVMATDLGGELLWDLSIGENDNFGYMIQAPLSSINDSILLGVATRSINPTANAEVIIFGLRVDGTLAFVKELGWPYWYTPSYDRFSQIHALSDSSFLFTSYSYTPLEEPLPPYGYVVAMDTSYQVLWHLFNDQIFHSFQNRIFRILRLSNGDFVGVGSKLQPVSHDGVSLSQHVGWAFRCSADGVLVWERHYAVPEAISQDANLLNNVFEGQDESIYMIGGVLDSIDGNFPFLERRKNWVIKVGPDGCIDPGCSEQVIILPAEETFHILPESHLRVYPNPVRNMLQVSWEELPPGRATLSAYDVSGRLLGDWPITESSGALSLDIRHWPCGVAILSLRSAQWLAMPAKVMVE